MMMESIVKARKRRKNPAWSGLALWQGKRRNFRLVMITGLSRAIIITANGYPPDDAVAPAIFLKNIQNNLQHINFAFSYGIQKSLACHYPFFLRALS